MPINTASCYHQQLINLKKAQMTPIWWFYTYRVHFHTDDTSRTKHLHTEP